MAQTSTLRLLLAALPIIHKEFTTPRFALPLLIEEGIERWWMKS